MKKGKLSRALDELGRRFQHLNWVYPDVRVKNQDEKVLYWPGDPKESVMICVLKDFEFQENFHRHGFFFLNYAYRSDYTALSQKRGNFLTVRENECYIGQPFNGYALRQSRDADAIILGVLVKTETFYREFLPMIVSDMALFHFFLDPQGNQYAESFIHVGFPKDSAVRTLLEMMVVEYANKKEDTEAILKPMVSALLLHVARRCREIAANPDNLPLAERIVAYMSRHTHRVTLQDIADEFSYHPNYISNLLRQETGNSFSEILLRLRMERAELLLKGSPLSIEEIAAMLGYSNNSHFYKAFRAYYHIAPREYVDQSRNSQ